MSLITASLRSRLDPSVKLPILVYLSSSAVNGTFPARCQGSVLLAASSASSLVFQRLNCLGCLARLSHCQPGQKKCFTRAFIYLAVGYIMLFFYYLSHLAPYCFMRNPLRSKTPRSLAGRWRFGSLQQLGEQWEHRARLALLAFPPLAAYIISWKSLSKSTRAQLRHLSDLKGSRAKHEHC